MNNIETINIIHNAIKTKLYSTGEMMIKMPDLLKDRYEKIAHDLTLKKVPGEPVTLTVHLIPAVSVENGADITIKVSKNNLVTVELYKVDEDGENYKLFYLSIPPGDHQASICKSLANGILALGLIFMLSEHSIKKVSTYYKTGGYTRFQYSFVGVEKTFDLIAYHSDPELLLKPSWPLGSFEFFRFGDIIAKVDESLESYRAQMTPLPFMKIPEPASKYFSNYNPCLLDNIKKVDLEDKALMDIQSYVVDDLGTKETITMLVSIPSVALDDDCHEIYISRSVNSGNDYTYRFSAGSMDREFSFVSKAYANTSEVDKMVFRLCLALAVISKAGIDGIVPVGFIDDINLGIWITQGDRPYAEPMTIRVEGDKYVAGFLGSLERDFAYYEINEVIHKYALDRGYKIGD